MQQALQLAVAVFSQLSKQDARFPLSVRAAAWRFVSQKVQCSSELRHLKVHLCLRAQRIPGNWVPAWSIDFPENLKGEGEGERETKKQRRAGLFPPLSSLSSAVERQTGERRDQKVTGRFGQSEELLCMHLSLSLILLILHGYFCSPVHYARLASWCLRVKTSFFIPSLYNV